MLRTIFGRSVTLLILTLGVISFFSTSESLASNISGSEISYRWIDTMTYEVEYIFYRECSGQRFTGTNSAKVVCSTSAASASLSLTLVSVTEVNTACVQSGAQCSGSNQYNSGKGMERLVFLDTVDFRSSAYKSLVASGCTSLRFEYSRCCRNSGITTGAANADEYNYAKIDLRFERNSSPKFLMEPVPRLKTYEPTYANFSAYDTIDGDSVSYAIVAPLSSYNKRLSTQVPPITSYYPSGISYPYTNPGGNPPIGFYVDGSAGDVIFTPMKAGEVTVLVMEVKEWRRDTSGKMINIGTVQRDLMYTVANNAGNNPPLLKTRYSFSVCEEDTLCFTINTEDKVYVPPPPTPKPDPDTTSLSWSGGIPGATFTVSSTAVQNQSAKFCWVPQPGTASAQPYMFSVRVRDNNCPRNAVSTRTISIKVNKSPDAKAEINHLGCGVCSVESKVSGATGPRYRWEIMDTAGNYVFGMKKGPYFQSTNNIISVKQSDTVTFRASGTYVIHHVISDVVSCEKHIYDTVVVAGIPEVELASKPDTFVCEGTTLRLMPSYKNVSGKASYRWSSGDTVSHIDVQLKKGVTDSLFRLDVTDSSGCMAWDTVWVFQRQNPGAVLGKDQRICSYDSIAVLSGNVSLAQWNDPRDTSGQTVPQGDTLHFEWYRNNTLLSTDSNLYGVNVEGKYALRVIDSLGCIGEDSMQLWVNDTVSVDVGKDQTVCWNDQLVLVNQEPDTSGGQKSSTYRWFDINLGGKIKMGTGDSLKYNIRKTTLHLVELYVTEGGQTCMDSDTVLVTVQSLPDLTMPQDTNLCVNDQNMDLRQLENAPYTGGRWFCLGVSGFVVNDHILIPAKGADPNKNERWAVYYEVKDTATGCNAVDSFHVSISLINRVKVRDSAFCQSREVVNLEDDRILLLPGGASLSLGRQKWTCIDCGSYDPSKIIRDMGTGMPGAPQDFVLNIDKNAIPLGSSSSDSIELEFEYTNIYGCSNWDTAVITIVGGSGGTASFSDVCWSSDTVNLKTISNTNGDGYWQAVSEVGFDSAHWVNDALNGDLLATGSLSRPAVSGQHTFKMHFVSALPGCHYYNDATLRIKGSPDVHIDHSPLSVNSTQEPYAFCVLDSKVSLSGSPAGGAWSSSFGTVLSGSVFSPSASTRFNEPIYLRYEVAGSNGCKGVDSVAVEVHAEQRLQMPADTAFTWYQDTMSLDLRCEYFNSTGVRWLPLTFNSWVSSKQTRNTTFTFIASPDSLTRHLLYAQTLEDGASTCPFDEATMIVTIAPDPCIKYDIDYNLSGGKMTLKPLNDLMASYRWEVGDTMTNTKQPVIDVSGFKDSIVWVKLITINQLGDSCTAATKINLKTGSVRTLEQAIRIYPNPVEESFVLDMDAPDLKGVEIFDATGRLVRYVELDGKTVDCSELLPGVYTLKLKHEGQVYLGRFVKR